MIWIWTGWLLALTICFAILGAKALVTGMTTLSRHNWKTFQAWPAIAVVFGTVFADHSASPIVPTENYVRQYCRCRRVSRAC